MLMERTEVAAICVAIALTGTASFASTPASRTPPDGCEFVNRATGAGRARTSVTAAFPPAQLDISTPFEPTLFPSGGLNYLIYELHLQNYTDEPMTLRGLEIIDRSNTTNQPLAAFHGSDLYERVLSIGADNIDSNHPLEGGKRAVVFICLAFGGPGIVPDRLSHRVLVDNAAAEGADIGTRSNTLKVLTPPVTGTDWVAANGPSIHSHHRTGLFVAGGRAQISRRYAIDWRREKQGTTFSGDESKADSYHAYGERVFAVADATVFSAVDGIPDNIPRTAAGFSTAVPMTIETVAGNAIILDLGDGQFAYYAHLKPGSVRVKKGDRVQRGDAIGQIGNSGDARWPHLHFQVATGPDILASEGVPFLVDRYRTRGEDGTWQTRTREYPLGDIAVEFVADTVTPDQ